MVPKPVDVQQALAEAMETLTPLGADLALIGGVALAVHGIERFTKDVDLATTTTLCAAAEAALGPDTDPLPLRLGGISFRSRSGVRVDLIDRRALLAKPDLDYRRARDIVHRHVGPYAARRLDKLARAAHRTDAPDDYAGK